MPPPLSAPCLRGMPPRLSAACLRGMHPRLSALCLLGIYPRRVSLEGLIAVLDPFFRCLSPGGAEGVALAHSFQPVLQLDEVDLVLLELGVGEVGLVGLLLHLPEEVMALV